MVYYLSTKLKGFSLVELMFSIAVAGVLSSMSMAIFTKYKDKAYQTELVMAMRDLATASEATYFEIDAAMNADSQGGGSSARYSVSNQGTSDVLQITNQFDPSIKIGEELLSHLTKNGNMQFSMYYWRADTGSGGGNAVYLWKVYYASTCKTSIGAGNSMSYAELDVFFQSRSEVSPTVINNGKNLTYSPMFGIGGTSCL